MASGMCFEFDASHVASDLLVLGASVEVAKARCHYCSSKLCLSFGPFQPRSQQQRRLCKNHDVGTASFQLPSSKTATK